MAGSLYLSFLFAFVVVFHKTHSFKFQSWRSTEWKRLILSRLRQAERDFSYYDFTTITGWEEFYQDRSSSSSSSSSSAAAAASSFEWHRSISLDEIATKYVSVGSKCLIPGCGNDLHLPEVLLSTRNAASVDCVDGSPTCLDQLRQYFGDEQRLTYVCEDVVSFLTRKEHESYYYDVIVDKGLTDAIMCGEGWDAPLLSLFKAAAACLADQQGTFLLISYRLSNATKQFIDDAGQQAGITWSFDLPESNSHISVSIARRLNR